MGVRFVIEGSRVASGTNRSCRIAKHVTETHLKSSDRLKVGWCSGIQMGHSGEAGKKGAYPVSDMHGVLKSSGGWDINPNDPTPRADSAGRRQPQIAPPNFVPQPKETRSLPWKCQYAGHLPVYLRRQIGLVMGFDQPGHVYVNAVEPVQRAIAHDKRALGGELIGEIRLSVSHSAL